MSLTKQQLQVLNTTNFPNNSTGYITPELLREFNSQSIETMATQTDLDTLSGSVSTQLINLNNFSSSLVTNFATVTQLNNSSSALQAQINTLAGTASLNTLSQSVYVQFDAQTQTNANVNNRFNADEAAFNSYTQSNNVALGNKASLTTDNYFVGNQYVTGNGTFTGNIYAANLTGSANDTSSLVTTSSFNSFTASVNSEISAIESFTASISTSVGLLQTFSGSQYKADSASFSTRIENVIAGGGYVSSGSFNAYTASNDIRVDNLNLISASFNSYTSSTNNRLNSLESATSSYAISSSVAAVDIAQDGRIASLTALTSSTAYTNVSNSFGGTQTFNNVVVNGTASVNFLNVIYQSSSIIYSSGSNILGDNANDDTQTLIGRTIVTGSFEVTGSSRFNGNVSITGSGDINGSPIIVSSQTSSMAVSSSTYAVTASYALNAQTASEARNLVVIARNGNQSTLSAGTVVHITGASGDNPIFNTASFDTEALSANTLGIIRTTTTSGADCEVVVNGIVLGVNTDPSNGYVAGDVIYLSSSGQFTRVQPQAPQQIVVLGQVLRAQQNNGSIYVNISNGWELNELHNVQINTPLTNDLLAYESSSYGLWKNKSISTLGLATTSSVNEVSNSLNTFSQSYVNDSSSFNSRITSVTGATGSYATTGSNTFNGNQIVNGTLQISSSATYDLDITGAWQATAASRISGSQGINSLTQTFNQISASTGLSIMSRGYVMGQIGSNQIAIFSSGSSTIGSFTTAPIGIAGIAINSGSTANQWYYPIQFQPSTGYTDGRVQITTPLSASIITGSNTLISGTFTVSNSSSLQSTNLTGFNNLIGDNNISGTLYVTASGGIILTGSLQLTGSTLEIAPSGTLVYGDKTVIKFYPSVTGVDTAISRFDKDGISIFQYQGQPTPFGFRYTADQLNDYTGSQIRVATTNDGVAYDDYIQYISASGVTTSGQVINGIQNTNGLVINQKKAFLQQELAYFDKSVLISQSLQVTGSTYFGELTGSLGAFSASVDSRLDVTATTGSNSFNGNQTITGSVIMSSSAAVELTVVGGIEITGSVAGNITTVTVASSTASINFSSGSFFTLTIPSSSVTYITGSNLKPGMTANIILTQQSTTGSVRFEPSLFKFPSGSINTGSAVASAVDMVSVASVNGTTLYSVTARQLQ